MAQHPVVPIWLLGGAAYLVLHLTIYAAVLRHLPAFGREHTIFLYHSVSATGTALSIALWLLIQPRPDGLALFIGLCCAHGIYSLSFLELWSLAEGGYSLQILRSLAEENNAAGLTRNFHAIGETKRAARLEGLVRLRLVECQADRLKLTQLGQGVARVLGSIAWLTHLRETG